MQQTTARSDPRDFAGFAAVPLPSETSHCTGSATQFGVMQQPCCLTASRQLAILHNSPEFQQWRAGDGAAQAHLEAPPRQLRQSLQPLALPLLATMVSTKLSTLGVTARLCNLSHILHHILLAFLQCLLLLTMLLLRPASNDADQWQGSFASWEDASKQLQANEHEWAPPGAFAAALSTFKATLQDVTHSTNGLKKVCSSILLCRNGCGP